MSFMNKLSNLVFGPEDDEDMEFPTVEESNYEEPAPAVSSKKSKVVNIAATTQMKVVVLQIERFEESQEAANHLRSKKPVVINLEKLEKDTAR